MYSFDKNEINSQLGPVNFLCFSKIGIFWVQHMFWFQINHTSKCAFLEIKLSIVDPLFKKTDFGDPGPDFFEQRICMFD